MSAAFTVGDWVRIKENRKPSGSGRICHLGEASIHVWFGTDKGIHFMTDETAMAVGIGAVR